MCSCVQITTSLSTTVVLPSPGVTCRKKSQELAELNPKVGAGFDSVDRLVGLAVKASASRAEDPGFDSRLTRDFFGVESYQ